MSSNNCNRYFSLVGWNRNVLSQWYTGSCNHVPNPPSPPVVVSITSTRPGHSSSESLSTSSQTAVSPLAMVVMSFTQPVVMCTLAICNWLTVDKLYLYRLARPWLHNITSPLVSTVTIISSTLSFHREWTQIYYISCCTLVSCPWWWSKLNKMVDY